MTEMLLVGDIGGTKTLLALLTRQHGARHPLAEARFICAEFPDLETIIQTFLQQIKPPIDPRRLTAVLALAGPIIQDSVTITNLPWRLERCYLEQVTGIPRVILMNDLAATAYAVPFLMPHELHTLQTGSEDRSGAIAVIAPGTGLGEAFLTRQGNILQAHPSEGGHSTFAPQNAFEIGLLTYLMKRYDHVSYERVCSGIGIPNVYAYLRDEVGETEPDWLHNRLATADDPTPVIIAAALDQEKPCPLCTKTLEAFLAILGAEAGNLAAKVMATGGVYLGGGIPPHILSALESGPFLQAFRRKGRLSNVLAQIPVQVILNSKAALLGAACYGLESTKP